MGEEDAYHDAVCFVLTKDTSQVDARNLSEKYASTEIFIWCTHAKAKLSGSFKNYEPFRIMKSDPFTVLLCTRIPFLQNKRPCRFRARFPFCSFTAMV